jgi:hypothetical protein
MRFIGITKWLLLAILISGCATHDYQLYEASSKTLVCVLFCMDTETKVKDNRKGVKNEKNTGLVRGN